MDETLHEDELLLRYLNNEMDTEETAALTSRLQADAFLKQRLETLQVIIETVKQIGTIETVQGIHKEMMKELNEKERAPVKTMFQRTLSFAAAGVVLILIAGGWWFYQLSPESVFKENYRSYTIAISRGSANKELINTLFAGRNYDEIVARSKTHSLSGSDSLLVGIAYLETGKPAESVKWFNAIQARKNQFRQDADYYLSMSYLKDKEYSRALRLMEQIKADRDHFYRNQISGKLLRNIRILKWK